MAVSSDTVLGGETTCLLDLPSAGSRPTTVLASAVEVVGGGRGGYAPLGERSGNGGREGTVCVFLGGGVGSKAGGGVGARRVGVRSG